MDVYDEADLYCAAFDWPVGPEVDWLLARAPGAKTVVEPMCGNARYGPAFADRGLRYHGVDRAAAMLARAVARDDVTVTRADARSFSLPIRFDLAWCPINSIRHLARDDDLVEHLRCVRAHLAPGGVYVVEIDLIRRDGPWRDGPDRKSQWTVELADGSTVEATWCPVRCELASKRVWEQSTLRHRVHGQVAREITHVYEMKMTWFDDWRDLASQAGFAIAEAFAHNGANRPPVTLSPELDNTGLNYYFVLR